MIHQPLTLSATAWEGGARPLITMIGGHVRIASPGCVSDTGGAYDAPPGP